MRVITHKNKKNDTLGAKRRPNNNKNTSFSAVPLITIIIGS
jgi:hypothetical protein